MGGGVCVVAVGGWGVLVPFVVYVWGAVLLMCMGRHAVSAVHVAVLFDLHVGVTPRGRATHESSQPQGLSCPQGWVSLTHLSVRVDRWLLLVSTAFRCGLGTQWFPAPPPSTTHLVLGLVRLCTLCNPHESLVAHISMGSRSTFGTASTCVW